MSQTQLYPQFKRSGAYTLFVDESEMGRTTVGDTAIHLLIGQSKFGSAPINTLVRIQDTTELFNTFGRRDTWMERRGNYFINHAIELLAQAPIFMINIQKFDDDISIVETISVKPAKDGKYSFEKTTPSPLTSVYDRTGFWKVDREVFQSKMEGLLAFSTFNTKSGSIAVQKADMRNTEFEFMTVADYNSANPNRRIECVGSSTKMADLFFKVDLFASKLTNDLDSNYNPELGTYIKLDSKPNGTSLVLGDTLVEQNAKYNGLVNLPSSNYVDSYVGCIIPNVYSSLNDAVSIDKVFNTDSKLSGMVCSINEEIIEDWTMLVDEGNLTEINEYLAEFAPTASGTAPNPVQIIDIKGAIFDKDQYVDGTRAKQNEILDILTTRGIKSGILDYKTNDFSYLVDSFKSYIEPNSKFQLAQLARDSKRFTYLYSAPFIKDFAKLPTYQDDNGVFDSKYIPQGGNPNVSDPVLYSMPSAENGDYATFPFAGELIFDDGNSQVVVPANIAGAIAYGAKHLSATRKPYSIVNGMVNGTVAFTNIVDTAYKFTNYDSDKLEPFGWNMVVKSNTVFQINNDATAKNIVKSALSYASNVELIDYIAREGRLVLERLVGERNNDVTRLRAKTGLDAICNKLRAEGVIETYTNTVDLTNNTAQVRNAGILLADTVIETADGIKIAVHRIHVKLKQDGTGIANQ